MAASPGRCRSTSKAENGNWGSGAHPPPWERRASPPTPIPNQKELRSMNRFLASALALAMLAPAASSPPAPTPPRSTPPPPPPKPSLDAAKKEGAKFISYGMPDDWANFGEIFRNFCQQYACAHEDTDMSSAEEITKFDAEKNNAQASVADIGMPFGPLAVKKGVTLAYKSAAWVKVPDWAKDKDGKWVGSYVGVATVLGTTGYFKNHAKT